MSRVSIIIFTGICFSGANAWAALTGSYTNGSGMTALNALAGNPFAWSVDKVDNSWVYTYSFVPSGNNRGVAFIDLEVGDILIPMTSPTHSTIRQRTRSEWPD